MDENFMFRTDFRLLHGQIVTGWVKRAGIDRIAVVDDETKASEYLQTVFEMAKPEGVKLKFYSVEQAGQRWERRFGIKPPHKALVLFKTPQSALAALKAGVAFDRLQIGTVEGGPDKVNVEGIYFLDENDARAIQDMVNVGVDVYFQSMVESKPLSWESIRSKSFPDVH